MDSQFNMPGESNTQGFETNNFSHRESWTSMVQNLYADLGQLWERQSLLVRSEIYEKVADIKAATSSLVIGGVVLFTGVMCLVATAIIALDIVMELWMAAGIVTLLLLVVGGIMVAGAKKKLDGDRLKPTRSLETMGVIKNTFQERIHEFQRH